MFSDGSGLALADMGDMIAVVGQLLLGQASWLLVAWKRRRMGMGPMSVTAHSSQPPCGRGWTALAKARKAFPEGSG